MKRLALAVVLALLFVLAPATPSNAWHRISWSGHTWAVKDSGGYLWGPGPNVWSDRNAWVDAAGRLNLKIARSSSGTWQSAEVIRDGKPLGYGTYRFTIASNVSALDPNVVLGLFLWDARGGAYNREMDIEFSKWGSASSPTNAQYVVQPWWRHGNLFSFRQPAGSTTHQFTWAPGRVTFSGPAGSWTYTGPDVPVPGSEDVRINAWLYNGKAPAASVTLVVSSFTFTPA
jgi:hypothetical protein